MTYLYLHNPRCSKSRQGLAYLEEKGVDVQVRKYLEEPLSLDELRILNKKLGGNPADWIRWKEDEAQGLSKDAPPMDLLKAMAETPKIMERPILMTEDTAVVGRPTENFEALL